VLYQTEDGRTRVECRFVDSTLPRLKNPPSEGSGDTDYFDELLERIRDSNRSFARLT